MSVHNESVVLRDRPAPAPGWSAVGSVRSRHASVLEVAAEVLAVRPAASLADIARAAGIGRTTLHKQYATRDDLLIAVGHRALDVLHAAIADASRDTSEDPAAVGETLDRLVAAFVPLGPEVAFLFRQPLLNDEPEIVARMSALDPPLLELVHGGQRAGLLRTDMPDAWFVSTLYAQTYVAWEGVAAGWLAPRDAPGLVTRTLMEGLCAPGCAEAKGGNT